MDKIKIITKTKINKNELTQYTDFLFRAVIAKCGNICDAEDLVQDTLLAALNAAENNVEVKNVKSWLLTVLNHKFYDMLRRKYRKPTISFDVGEELKDDNLVYEELEKSEEMEHIRRELAYLSRIYREVLVRFYMHGESIKTIANVLGIPENTVKSRLDTGRKSIRKELDMDNNINNNGYVKQSWEPEYLWINNSGQSGIDGEPFSLVGSDMIVMNLLILAYKKPVTITELSKKIGIAAAYVEPIIDKLVNNELMKRVNNTIYTDFIIYEEKDRTASFVEEREAVDLHYKNRTPLAAGKLRTAERTLKRGGGYVPAACWNERGNPPLEEAVDILPRYKEMWVLVSEGLNELRGEEFYIRQNLYQQLKLEIYFAIKTLLNAVNCIRDEVCGSIPFSDYPERPNGSKWYCMGHRYPKDYDWSNRGQDYHFYNISGEASVIYDNFKQAKHINLREYDTTIGTTHSAYSKFGNIQPNDVLKILYAVYSDNIDDFDIINKGIIKHIDDFCNIGYLKKIDGKIHVDLPILSSNEWHKICNISEKTHKVIANNFRDTFISIVKQSEIKIPQHLKNIPGFQRYMYSLNSVPMMVIHKVKDKGCFLERLPETGYKAVGNVDNDIPCPGALLIIDK